MNATNIACNIQLFNYCTKKPIPLSSCCCWVGDRLGFLVCRSNIPSMSVECQNIYRMQEVQLSLSSSETTFQKSNHKHKHTENLNFSIVPDFLWKCRAGSFTKMPSGTGRDSKRLVLVKPLNRCLLPRLKSERYVIIQKSASINSLVSIS